MLLHIYILSTENRSKAYLNLDDNRVSLRDLALPNLNYGGGQLYRAPCICEHLFSSPLPAAYSGLVRGSGGPTEVPNLAHCTRAGGSTDYSGLFT